MNDLWYEIRSHSANITSIQTSYWLQDRIEEQTFDQIFEQIFIHVKRRVKHQMEFDHE